MNTTIHSTSFRTVFTLFLLLLLRLAPFPTIFSNNNANFKDMTQTAVLAGNEQQINFLNIFIRSKTAPDNVDDLSFKSNGGKSVYSIGLENPACLNQ